MEFFDTRVIACVCLAQVVLVPLEVKHHVDEHAVHLVALPYVIQQARNNVDEALVAHGDAWVGIAISTDYFDDLRLVGFDQLQGL